MFKDHDPCRLSPFIMFIIISSLLLHLFSSPAISMAEKKEIEPIPELVPHGNYTYPNPNQPLPKPVHQGKDTYPNPNQLLPDSVTKVKDTYPNPNQSFEKPKLSPQDTKPLGFYEYQFYKSFGGYGLGNGYFRLPVDIGVDRDDNIYICDMEAGKIQTFDSEGNFDKEWDNLSLENDKYFRQSSDMDEPKAIYVDYKDRIGEIVIYVADTKNNRVLEFNTYGHLINPKDPEGDEFEDTQIWSKTVEEDSPCILWGEFGSDECEFHHPTDIAIDQFDNCYILDSKNSRIQCFDYEGKFKFEWGGFGSGPGNFLKPTRMAYDPTGFRSIWVIDSKDGRFHKFDLNGEFIKAFIPKDQSGHPLPSPADLCFDSQGFIYVTDSSLNKVFKYNNDIEYIQCWGEKGSGPGQFKDPKGIAVDSEDRVLVVDSGNFRIQIFRHF